MGSPQPPVPTYGGSPTPNTTTASNPDDIWRLHDIYNKPVGAGTTPAHGANPMGRRGGPMTPEDAKAGGGHQVFTTTQDIMAKYNHLWAVGTAGNKKENQKALAEFEQMQMLLLQSGAYGNSATLKDFRFGQWDAKTNDALVNALEGYEQSIAGADTPMEFTDWLTQNRDGGSVNGKSTADPTSMTGGSGAAPQQTQLSDPNQIRDAAQTAAQAALGEGLSQDQLNKFVAQFQGAQASYQQSANSTVVAPDMQSDAMAYAQHDDPQKYANHQATGYMNALINLFGPKTGQRANITPVANV